MSNLHRLARSLWSLVAAPSLTIGTIGILIGAIGFVIRSPFLTCIGPAAVVVALMPVIVVIALLWSGEP